MSSLNCKNILIGCTGSVATIRLPILIQSLLEVNSAFNIKVVVTEHAKHFIDEDEIPKQVGKIYHDEDEWEQWRSRGDPVLHIELSKWADVLLVAPLDANTLAKLATGICDNLLSCIARAWNFDEKPCLFAPAMNTMMWQHPVTALHVETLVMWGWKQIPPISKKLMCGDTGIGAMAEVPAIVKTLLQVISPQAETQSLYS